MNPNELPPPAQLMKYIVGKWNSKPIYVAAGNEPSIAKLLDLEMLVTTGGRERTEAEFKYLLEQSGFKLSRIIPTKDNVSIIEGIIK